MKEEQASPHFPNSFYRVTVKGLYVQDGKVLLVKDFSNPSKKDGEWELPGGGLDFGENFVEGLKREVKEEMGLTVTATSPQPLYLWIRRREKSRNMEWFYVLVMIFKMDLADLNFTPSEECREIQFFSKEDLLKNKADMSELTAPLIDLFNPKDFE